MVIFDKLKLFDKKRDSRDKVNKVVNRMVKVSKNIKYF